MKLSVIEMMVAIIKYRSTKENKTQTKLVREWRQQAELNQEQMGVFSEIKERNIRQNMKK